SDPGITALEVSAAYAAMRELSDPLREAIVAVDVVGLSYRQAAHALRIREGTVMSRLSRARERVAAALEGGTAEPRGRPRARTQAAEQRRPSDPLRAAHAARRPGA